MTGLVRVAEDHDSPLFWPRLPLPAALSDEQLHGGKTWESLTGGNVWEPGVSGWREVTTGGPPVWVQPTGSQDAYNTGDRVIYQGSVYESKINANVWSPAGYPAGWTLIP